MWNVSSADTLNREMVEKLKPIILKLVTENPGKFGMGSIQKTPEISQLISNREATPFEVRYACGLLWGDSIRFDNVWSMWPVT